MKPKIRTSTFWNEKRERYDLSFKVSWYREDGRLKFSEKIFPMPSSTENEAEALDILIRALKIWLGHYKFEWEDFYIDDKRIHSILTQEIAEKDIPF